MDRPYHHLGPHAAGALGGPRRLARLTGMFVGFLGRDGARAWLALQDGELIPVAWPEGFCVRFHPLEMFDKEGTQVAEGGAYVALTGGFLPPGETPTTQDILELFVAHSINKLEDAGAIHALGWEKVAKSRQVKRGRQLS